MCISNAKGMFNFIIDWLAAMLHFHMQIGWQTNLNFGIKLLKLKRAEE